MSVDGLDASGDSTEITYAFTKWRFSFKIPSRPPSITERWIPTEDARFLAIRQSFAELPPLDKTLARPHLEYAKQGSLPNLI